MNKIISGQESLKVNELQARSPAQYNPVTVRRRNPKNAKGNYFYPGIHRDKKENLYS